MAAYQTHPSPAPGAWNAPSYSTPYHNPGSIFSPVGTIQHTNMFPNTQHTNVFPNTQHTSMYPAPSTQHANLFVNTQQIQMFPNVLSPAITTHALQPTQDNIFSVHQFSDASASENNLGKSKVDLGKSKVELELEQQLEDAKKRYSELVTEQEKLQNGARGLKDELERLQKESEQKKRDLKKAEDAYVRQEQANIAAAISASAGGTVDDKKRYIGALQEAMKRKLNNLDALHLTVSNYEAQATNDKRTISELEAPI